MTYEEFKAELKKDLLKNCDDNENNVEKYLEKNEDWIKRSYKRNSNSIDGIAYAMSLDYDI